MVAPASHNFDDGKLELLERDRCKYEKWSKHGGRVVKFFLVVCILCSFLPFVGFVTIPAGIVMMVTYLFAVYLPWQRFRKSFKAALVHELVDSISPELNYYPEQGISENVFTQASLYKRKSSQTYRTEDLISGRLGKTDLQLGEVELIDHREGEGALIEISDDIKLMFFVADFHKHFSGQTYVVPKKKSVLNKLNPFKNTMTPKSPKVQMEDVSFNQVFDVHSSDPQEARYILSIGMLSRILAIENTFGGVRLAFKDSCVWVAIPYNGAFLEPDLKRSVHDQQQLAEMKEEIHRFLSLVEELDLNTRIWTKH